MPGHLFLAAIEPTSKPFKIIQHHHYQKPSKPQLLTPQHRLRYRGATWVSLETIPSTWRFSCKLVPGLARELDLANYEEKNGFENGFGCLFLWFLHDIVDMCFAFHNCFFGGINLPSLADVL